MNGKKSYATEITKKNYMGRRNKNKNISSKIFMNFKSIFYV